MFNSESRCEKDRRVQPSARIVERWMRLACTTVIVIGSLTAFAGFSFAQKQDQSRGLHVKKLEDNRPAATQPVDPKQPRTYRSTTSMTSSSELRKSGSDSEAVIGVTLWRLQAAESNSDGPRLLEQKGAKRAEWTAQRVDAGARINEGERVRVSIESPGSGYLYVIDREQYSDGSLGDAYLIFPTLRTRGGNNLVAAGRVIEFPAQEDNPPYFTLTRSRADHVAEVLNLLISPQPLVDLPVGDEPAKIALDKLARWEKEWGGKTEQFELEGGSGLPYTPAEKAAAATETSRLLTQGDPLPQTILRVNTKPGSAVLVKVVLRIAQ